MVEIDNKQQEEGIKHEDFGNDIKNLINQIDELKDENKDNDELVGVFEQGSQVLDNGLYNALRNCDIDTLDKIRNEVSRIYNESDSIGLDINVKLSLKSLLDILTNVTNQIKEPGKDSNEENELEQGYKEIGSIWNMELNDYDKMQKSLGENTFIKKIEKEGDRYSYNPEKLRSYLNNIKGNDWKGFLKMLDKGKNGKNDKERNDNMGKWRAVITAIQILLNEKFPDNPIVVDGKYGTKTKNTVNDFQVLYNKNNSNKLTTDGKPGIHTINALLGNTIEETSENGTYIEIGGHRFLEQKDDNNNYYITREGQKYSKYEPGKQGKYYYIPEDKSHIFIGEEKNGESDGYGIRIDEQGNNYRGFFEDDNFKGDGVYSRAESGNVIEGYFENGLMQNGIIKTKGDNGEESYDVERDTYKGLKITSGDKIGKYIDDYTGYIVDNSTAIEDLTKEQIDNIERMWNIGIKIHEGDFDLVKDLTKEQIDNIERIKIFGYDVNIDNISDLSQFDDTDFEILGINSETLYESYDYTESEIESHKRYKKGKIVENIEDYIQNIISENRDIGKSEIIEYIRSDLVTLPVKERIDIIIGINKSVNKFNTVRKYLDFNNPENKYKTPKDLLCAIRGIDDPDLIANITNNITVAQHGVGMMFFVGDKDSYEIIYDPGSKENSGSGGFNCERSYIEELEGSLSVINGENSDNNTENDTYGTVRHEGQHNRNTYFMPDHNGTAITSAKDEITAYLRDGTGIFTDEDSESRSIEEILTEPEDEGGLYQYDLEGEEWEQHKKGVRELLSYANDLINLTVDSNTGLTRDNIISMLSSVPADQRKNLHDYIINAVNTHNTKYLLNEFRRAGTAEKQTTIDEILVANTIEEVKHILSDPKYSHISWPPNNKCGLEISAIIDEVITGNLEITYVPSEIRPKVEQLIMK